MASSPADGAYKVKYDIKDFVSINKGILQAKNLNLVLFINNDDKSFSGDKHNLIIKENLFIESIKITYTFKDETGKTYEQIVKFKEIKIPAYFNKNIQ